MRKFWGFYDNGRCRVACNGGTVYIYDQANRELAKFQDIPYAYGGAFQPNTNLFVAKSTAGSLAVYDLDRLALVKKIVITRIGAQDEGFAFTPDGTYFYNIEKPVQSTRTQLTVYRTSDFEVCGVYFADDRELVLEALNLTRRAEPATFWAFSGMPREDLTTAFWAVSQTEPFPEQSRWSCGNTTISAPTNAGRAPASRKRNSSGPHENTSFPTRFTKPP